MASVHSQNDVTTLHEPSEVSLYASKMKLKDRNSPEIDLIFLKFNNGQTHALHFEFEDGKEELRYLAYDLRKMIKRYCRHHNTSEPSCFRNNGYKRKGYRFFKDNPKKEVQYWVLPGTTEPFSAACFTSGRFQFLVVQQKPDSAHTKFNNGLPAIIATARRGDGFSRKWFLWDPEKAPDSYDETCAYLVKYTPEPMDDPREPTTLKRPREDSSDSEELGPVGAFIRRLTAAKNTLPSAAQTAQTATIKEESPNPTRGPNFTFVFKNLDSDKESERVEARKIGNNEVMFHHAVCSRAATKDTKLLRIDIGDEYRHVMKEDGRYFGQLMKWMEKLQNEGSCNDAIVASDD